MEYKGKKYVSLKELSKDINVPYSPLMHRYYRTGDIEDAVLWAANAEEKKKSYVLWNRQYENVNSIALAFGLNAGSIFARLKGNESLEEIVKGLLQKELAEKIGVTDIALRASLKGNPTIGTLEKVANALDVHITELFDQPKNNTAGIACPHCGKNINIKVEL